MKPRWTPERFKAALLNTDGGCMEWTRRRDADGYGCFKLYYRQQLAHRYAWVLENGPIPQGMCVCHRCDNPPCCNPDHLFLGTNADNTADKVSKGRCAVSGRKLTAVQVGEIRSLLRQGRSRRSIAAVFGTHKATIDKICYGESYAGVALTSGDGEPRTVKQ